MKKLLPAQRFTTNFLRLKPGVVGGYRPKALVQADRAWRPVLGQRRQRPFDWPRLLCSQNRSLARPVEGTLSSDCWTRTISNLHGRLPDHLVF